jgi:hypothetical protein
MESTRFDQIAATVAQNRTRRTMLRLLGTAALGAGGLSLLGRDEGDARRRRGKKKHKHGKGKGAERCLKAGDLCEHDEQCCTDETGRICEVASNASNSDTTCCGGLGATCGGANADLDALSPFCCADLTCSTFDDPTATPGVCVRVEVIG